MSTTPPNAPLPSAPFTRPPACNQYTPLKALLTNVRFTVRKSQLPFRFRSVAHASGVSYVGSCQNHWRRPNRRTYEISLHTRALCLCCGAYAANPPGTGDDRDAPSGRDRGSPCFACAQWHGGTARNRRAQTRAPLPVEDYDFSLCNRAERHGGTLE
jgi:hypothetical protein